MNSKQLRIAILVLFGISGAAYGQKAQAGNAQAAAAQAAAESNAQQSAQPQMSAQPAAAQSPASSPAQTAVPIYGVTTQSMPTGSSTAQQAVPIYGVNTQAIQPTSAAQPAAAPAAIPGVSIQSAPTSLNSSSSASQSSIQATPSSVSIPGVPGASNATAATQTGATPSTAPAQNTAAQPTTSTGPDAPQGAMNSMSSDKPEAMMADSTPQPTAVNSTTTGGTPKLNERHPHYRVNIGDQLNIKFEFLPNYSEATIDVQPDGYISLEGGVPPIYVLGHTQQEVEAQIREAYKGIMREPIVVTVELNSYLPPYFICWGQVIKPGKYEMKGDITLSQAIGIAGGYNSNAKHSKVVLFRKVGDQWVSAQVINLKQMLYKANLSEDLHLQPGDMIWVPKNLVSKMQAVIPWNTFRMDYAPTGF